MQVGILRTVSVTVPAIASTQTNLRHRAPCFPSCRSEIFVVVSISLATSIGNVHCSYPEVYFNLQRQRKCSCLCYAAHTVLGRCSTHARVLGIDSFFPSASPEARESEWATRHLTSLKVSHKLQIKQRQKLLFCYGLQATIFTSSSDRKRSRSHITCSLSISFVPAIHTKSTD